MSLLYVWQLCHKHLSRMILWCITKLCSLKFFVDFFFLKIKLWIFELFNMEVVLHLNYKVVAVKKISQTLLSLLYLRTLRVVSQTFCQKQLITWLCLLDTIPYKSSLTQKNLYNITDAIFSIYGKNGINPWHFFWILT